MRFSTGLPASCLNGNSSTVHNRESGCMRPCRSRITAFLALAALATSFLTVGHAMDPVELILTQQWSNESNYGQDAYRNDVETAQESILSDPEVATPTIASTSALLKWIGHKEYVDVADQIKSAYQLLDPATLADGLNERVHVLSETSEDWVGWINAGLAAQALGDPEEAFLYFDNAIQCPNCVDSPGLRKLRGKTLLEAGDVKAAHLEYILAASMAIQTHDPSFVFRIRQEFADDFFDHGFLDEAVKIGYVCKNSAYPLETCWALGLEIVYKWSKDDLDGVAESVSRLSTLLPEFAPDQGSDWERRRYKQASFLFSTAESALEGDQLSRMILDVEATEFHYKRGEIPRAMERLKPWVQAYPPGQFMTFTPEEQDWALWANHNYALILNAMGRREEAEIILLEILNVLNFDDHPSHIAGLWCTLGKCLVLQGKESEGFEAIERGLDLDAIDITFTPTGNIDLRRQPRLQGAKMNPDVRAGVVHEYEILQAHFQGE